MASVREQIIETLLSRLNTGTPDGVPAVTRAREEPYSEDELPAAAIRAQREEIDYEAEGKRSYFRRRVLTLRVSLYFVGDDSIGDPMAIWVSSRLDGQTVPSLVEDCIEALYEWEYAAEDQPYTALHQDFRIHYHTLVGDQTRTQ